MTDFPRPDAPAPATPGSNQRRWPCPEVLVLFLVCTLDMISSAFFFHHGLANEANPLLRPFAEAGAVPFMLVKFLTYGPSLVVAEWQVRRRPRLFRPLLLAVTLVYIGIYAMGVAGQVIR